MNPAASSTALPYRVGVPHMGSLPSPRVFLYHVPDRYHEGLVQDDIPGVRGLTKDSENLGPHASDFGISADGANSQVGIQHCLMRSASRSMNASEANFFYMPFYPSMCWMVAVLPSLFRSQAKDAQSCAEIGQLLTEVSTPSWVAGSQTLAAKVASDPAFMLRLKDAGLEELPALWARAGGRDHILPAWGPYFGYGNEEWMLEGPIQLNGDFSYPLNLSQAFRNDRQRAGRDYMTQFGYEQKKDLIYPWHLFRDPRDVVAPDTDSERTFFLFYAASNLTFVPSSNNRRQTLMNLIVKQNDSLVVEMKNRTEPDVHGKMSESTFCPSLPGDTQLTSRPYDAILAACIPVILTDYRTPLPYDNVLDWSKFAVLLPSSSIEDGSFLSTLRGKTPSEVEELRRNVHSVRPYFMITPDCSSPSGMDMFLHQLALQQVDKPA
eukprot:gnl/TRDRNA2_/TRDRNA2_141739_c2_seq1.p1 gnl/TRDRNA2_/TRDRNA2_141739_c2~~gnl/TRDRNA2_/TRDRNA2_141739_c2_seq1.p1  ORF type:complete len:481 (-),score=50.87 gnl/TRDRNA2_/TRDRNA2_141739_c2_seq1:139-1446(-)